VFAVNAINVRESNVSLATSADALLMPAGYGGRAALGRGAEIGLEGYPIPSCLTAANNRLGYNRRNVFCNAFHIQPSFTRCRMSTQARCRRCGYAVAGLPSFICPECGGDLRDVGIRIMGEPRGSGRAGPMFAAALLWFVPAFILSTVLAGAVDRLYVTRSAEYEPLPLQDPPPPVQSLTLTLDGGGLRWRVGPWSQAEPVDHVRFDISVSGHAPPPSLTMDRSGLIEPNTSPTPRRLDRAIALAWVASAGLDPVAPSTQQLADDIVASMTDLAAGRAEYIGFADLTPRSGNYRATFMSARWIGRTPWLAAALAWAISVWQLRPRAERREVGCGRCWHAARDMVDFTCPSCGCDPREVGIRVIDRYRLTGTAALLTMAAIIVLVAGGVSAGIVDLTLWEQTADRLAIARPPFRQQAKAFLQSITIQCTGHRYCLSSNRDASLVPADRVLATFQTRGHRPATLCFDRNGTMSYVAAGAGGDVVVQAVDKTAILNVLRTTGLDPADAATERIANETMANVADAWAGQTNANFTGLEGAGGGSSSNGGDANSLASLQWMVWLAVWLWVTWRVARPRRRRAKHLRESQLA
jgi:hypothetical protein